MTTIGVVLFPERSRAGSTVARHDLPNGGDACADRKEHTVHEIPTRSIYKIQVFLTGPSKTTVVTPISLERILEPKWQVTHTAPFRLNRRQCEATLRITARLFGRQRTLRGRRRDLSSRRQLVGPRIDRYLAAAGHQEKCNRARHARSTHRSSGATTNVHPAIHGGLLARPTEDHHRQLLNLGWDYIDIVAASLYPFEETIAKPDVTYMDAIENIDIGGVTLIRAAAKNHERVTLICDPADYDSVLDELRSGDISPETRKQLSVKGFASTMHYDTVIYNYLSK